MESINPKAPVLCEKSIVIDTCAVEVWEILTAIEKWPEWNKDVAKSKLHGPLEAGTRFKWKTGGLTINSILHTVIPYTNFGWSGKTLGIIAIHNWTFTESKRETEVRVAESMEGFLPWLFKKVLTRSLEKSMQKWLELLKQECEKKEKVAA